MKGVSECHGVKCPGFKRNDSVSMSFPTAGLENLHESAQQTCGKGSVMDGEEVKTHFLLG